MGEERRLRRHNVWEPVFEGRGDASMELLPLAAQ
jgi:hypothetical protein